MSLTYMLFPPPIKHVLSTTNQKCARLSNKHVCMTNGTKDWDSLGFVFFNVRCISSSCWQACNPMFTEHIYISNHDPVKLSFLIKTEVKGLKQWSGKMWTHLPSQVLDPQTCHARLGEAARRFYLMQTCFIDWKKTFPQHNHKLALHTQSFW